MSLKLLLEKVLWSKGKIQAARWEKIFLKLIFDEGIASRIGKELLQLNNKVT